MDFDEIISKEDAEDQTNHGSEEDGEEKEHHLTETEFDIVNMTTVMFGDGVDVEKDEQEEMDDGEEILGKKL